MLDDWKRKIDQSQNEVYSKAQKEVEREKQAERDKEKDDWDYKTNPQRHPIHLAIHKMRFQCHVCGRPSEKPQNITQLSTPPFDMLNDVCSFVVGLDWSKPGDFNKCYMCNSWVCSNDYHNGICKSCAERLGRENVLINKEETMHDNDPCLTQFIGCLLLPISIPVLIIVTVFRGLAEVINIFFG